MKFVEYELKSGSARFCQWRVPLVFTGNVEIQEIQISKKEVNYNHVLCHLLILFKSFWEFCEYLSHTQTNTYVWSIYSEVYFCNIILWTRQQIRGSKRLSCHADIYTVSRCRTRGESRDHSSEKARKGSTLALKPMADVTKSPKQGYQSHHEKNICPRRIFKKNYSGWRINLGCARRCGRRKKCNNWVSKGKQSKLFTSLLEQSALNDLSLVKILF